MSKAGLQCLQNEALIDNGSKFQVALSDALGYIPGYNCFRAVSPYADKPFPTFVDKEGKTRIIL